MSCILLLNDSAQESVRLPIKPIHPLLATNPEEEEKSAFPYQVMLTGVCFSRCTGAASPSNPEHPDFPRSGPEHVPLLPAHSQFPRNHQRQLHPLRGERLNLNAQNIKLFWKTISQSQCPHYLHLLHCWGRTILVFRWGQIHVSHAGRRGMWLCERLEASYQTPPVSPTSSSVCTTCTHWPHRHHVCTTVCTTVCIIGFFGELQPCRPHAA